MNRTTSNQKRFNFSKRVLRASTALVAAGAMTFIPAAAKAVDDFATPTGEQVVGGDISFDRPELGQLDVTQTSDRGYINWESFNIGEQAETEFFQPGQNSLTVNKVTGPGNDPTQILGALKSNGQLMVLDQNGVFFGANSRVDVGGIIASTGDVDVNAVMDGADIIEITNLGNGTIENQGQITAAQAGLVGFVAPTVKNSGVINARLGKVAFAAGEKVTLDLYGDQLVEIEAGAELEDALLENSGVINAEGGRVMMTARAAKDAVDAIINMSGVINASSASVQGGSIVLDGGDKGVVAVSGAIEATGTSGGDVVVDGQNTIFTQTSTLDVSATDITEGQAGSAVLWGRENAVYAGDITALGKDAFVETSGGNLGVHGDVQIGAGGEWLLDPTNIEIVNFSNLDDSDILAAFGVGGIGGAGPTPTDVSFSPADPVDPPPPPGGVGGSGNGPLDGLSNQDSLFYVHDEIINNALNDGTNVTLRTADAGDAEGDILLRADAAIEKTSGDDATFTLEAHDDIRLLGTIGASGDGKLNVILTADFDGSAGDPGSIVVRNAIVTNGGDFTGTASGVFAMNEDASIDAQGGSVVVDQDLTFSSVNADSIMTSGTGTVSINQNDGGSIQNAVDAVENTGTGTNTINVGAGDYAESVSVYEDNFIMKGANAGTAGNGLRGAESTVTPNSPGFYVTGNNTTIDGFEITGATGSDGYGVWVDNATDATIVNNYIHDVSNDGVLVNRGSGASIENNLITDIDTQGDKSGSGVQVLNSIQVGVHNNVISDTMWDGVRLEQVRLSEVTGNDIDNVERVGVYGIAVKSVEISGNDVDTTRNFEGIGVFGGNNITIEENDVDDTAIDGVLAVNITSGLEILNNNIGQNGGADNIGTNGIRVTNPISENDTGANVFGNNVSNATENGILIADANGVTLDENVIDASGANGIYIQSSDDAIVGENTVTNSAENGILVNPSNNALIVSNWISTSGENGINVQGGTNNVIDDNTVIESAVDGIKVESFEDEHFGTVWISNNRVGLASTHGLGESVFASGDDGIEVVNGDYAAIYGNEIIGAGFYDGGSADGYGADGIHVRNVNGYEGDPLPIGDGAGKKFSPADVDIYDNDIAFTMDDGIEVLGGKSDEDSAYVYNNTVGHVGYEAPILGTLGDDYIGIKVSDISESEVYGNIVSSVVNDGIKVSNGDYTGIYDNRIALVGGNGIRVDNVDGGRAPDFEPFVVGSPTYASYEGAVEVTGNEIALTGENGIHVSDSGATKVILNTVTMAGIGSENVADEINKTASFVAGDVIPVFAFAEFAEKELVEIIEELEPSFTLEWSDGDGILVEDVYGGEGNLLVTAGIPTTDGPDYYEAPYSVVIRDNTVAYTGGDGIEVDGSDRVLIENNIVSEAGIEETVITGAESFGELVSTGPFGRGAGRETLWTEESEGNEWLGDDLRVVINDHINIDEVMHDTHDGIKVSNVYQNRFDGPIMKLGAGNAGNAGGGIDGYYGYAVDIIGNIVTTTGDDGIEVTNSSSTLIKDNVVFNAGYGGDEDYGSGDYYGADGIYVRNVPGERRYYDDYDYEGPINKIGPGNPGNAGDGFEEYAVVIDNNIVATTADDGIEVVGGEEVFLIEDRTTLTLSGQGTGRTLIIGNDVSDNGNGVGARDGYGSDGIHVRGVQNNNIFNPWDIFAVSSSGGAGKPGFFGGGFAVEIIDNDVLNTDDDGIEVLNSQSALIDNNRVTNAGRYYDGPIYLGRGDQNAGGDGITVRNVGLNNGFISRSVSGGGDYEGGFGGYAVEILNNNVNTTGDDGIEVSNSASVLIDNNEIYNAGSGRPDEEEPSEYYGGGDDYGADGIHVRNVAGGNRIFRGPKELLLSDGFYSEDGFEDYAVVVRNNYIDDTADDGIEVISDFEDYYYDGPKKAVLKDGPLSNEFITGRTLIEGNETYNNGVFFDEKSSESDFETAELRVYDDGPFYGGAPDGYGADGIHVRNVGDSVEVYDYDESFDEESGIYTYTDTYTTGARDAVIIRDNIVDTTGDDGVEVLFSGRTNIDNNDIDNSGYGERGYYGGADEWGADGIHVRGVIANTEVDSYTYTERYNEETESYEYSDDEYDYSFTQNSGVSVTITNNTVDVTEDDGIQVLDSGNSLIDNNELSNIGFGGGIFYEGPGTIDGNGSDGIHVRTGFVDLYNEYYDDYDYSVSDISEWDIITPIDYVDYFLSTSTVITNNTVTVAADDGIDVEGVTDVLIANNTTLDVEDDGIEVVGYAGDFLEFGSELEFGTFEGPTTEIPSFNVQILNNTVTNSADNGIKVEDVDTLLVDGNTVNTNDDGIDIESTDFITVSNNNVSNASDAGILIDELENGNVILSGNTLVNNDVHMRIESGRVDLTGPGNSFTGGRIGINFDGPLVSLIDNDPTDEFDGTLGAQTFTGQSSFYVELTNGALFGPGLPGEPNFYNALNSTFDGLTPSDTGGILTQAQLDFLESKFQHFNDIDTLGLFFFGAIDPIDQEDIFNSFGNFNGAAGAAGVTITGLPTISAAQTAALLNNLTPAAGGGENGEPSAEDLNEINPAAGGQSVGCWSDAVNAIESGATVNYDFGTSPESAISDTAACGLQVSSAQ